MDGAEEIIKRIDKLEAARRQLDCAIRLYFDGEDSLSIHTLAYAAFRILFDLYPRHRKDGFAEDLNKMIENFGWKPFTRIPNFLKHAEKDPGESIPDHSYDLTVTEIGFAATLYSRLAGRYTPEMRAFDDHIHFLHPDYFAIPADEDQEIDRRYREAVDRLKNASHEDQTAVGKALLQFYRDYPSNPRLTPPILERPKTSD
jgi:hypothetical protein